MELPQAAPEKVFQDILKFHMKLDLLNQKFSLFYVISADLEETSEMIYSDTEFCTLYLHLVQASMSTVTINNLIIEFFSSMINNYTLHWFTKK